MMEKETLFAKRPRTRKKHPDLIWKWRGDDCKEYKKLRPALIPPCADTWFWRKRVSQEGGKLHDVGNGAGITTAPPAQFLKGISLCGEVTRYKNYSRSKAFSLEETWGGRGKVRKVEAGSSNIKNLKR